MRAMDPTALARLALLSAILALSTAGTPAASNPTAVPASGPATASSYIVKAGDTLYSIATLFNTTVAALQQANNITNPNTLYVGQRLTIPSRVAQNVVTPEPTARGPTPAGTATQPPLVGGDTYIVKAGDTLASIAAQYGISVAELQRVNNIANPDVLTIGQRLRIPGPSTPTPLPEGVTLEPETVRQGQTLVLRVTKPGILQVQGKFDQQELKFNSIDGVWTALIGISRCANYVGNYPVSLTARDILGAPNPIQFEARVNPTNFTIANLTLTSQMSSLLDPAIMNAENSLVSALVVNYTPGQMWTGKFRMPLDVPNPRVSSFFGERRSYNGGAPGLCGHEGQDFAVPGGTPIYAPADGVVVLAKQLQVRGNVVFLDHGRGVFSGFYHMSKIIATSGQRVKAGDLLGEVGTTGFSTGDHLHWSMWVNGIYVDPIQWTTNEMP